MKKNDSYDFSQATRQSYAAILIIMYRLYKVLFRQLIPIFILVLIQGKLSKSQWFIGIIIGIAVIAAIYSIVAFFKYFFFINDNKLIVRKGVFKQSTLEIPFDRIQSINFEQNLIHRLFKVVKLNIDTAGSSKNELELNALDQNLANQLSERILSSSYRPKKKSTPILEKQAEEEKKIIFKLSFPQLLKVGITENHIRSGGVIIFFIFYIFDSLEDFGLDLIEQSENYLPVAQKLTQSMMIVLSIFILFVFISFIISLARNILRFYDLHMYRKGAGFVIVSGLLNKKEHAAKDNKIQLIKWSQNLLQQLSGIYEIVMKQASSSEVSDLKSINVVGLSKEDVAQTQKYVFKNKFPEIDQLTLYEIDFYYLFKRLYYWSLLFVPIIIVQFFFGRIDLVIYLGLLYLLFLLASILSYKKKKYGMHNSLIRLDGGTFGRSSTVMSMYKIQNISLTESFFQRRRQLGSLVLHTASGSMKIPDIPINNALNIKNYLLYKVETSRNRWM